MFSETTYRVVKIIDDKHIVINGGTNDYLSIDDKIDIFKIGEEVIDPETSESLGTLDHIKATLTITSIYPNMAVCKLLVNKPSHTFALLDMNRTYVSAESLNIDPMEISGGFEGMNKKILLGDLARSSPKNK